MGGSEVTMKNALGMGRLQNLRQQPRQGLKRTRLDRSLVFNKLFQSGSFKVVHYQIGTAPFLVGIAPFQWPQDPGMIDGTEGFDLMKDLRGLLLETIHGQDFDQNMNTRRCIVAKKVNRRRAGAQNAFRLQTIHRERSESIGVLGGGLIEKAKRFRPVPLFESDPIGVGQGLSLGLLVRDRLGYLLKVALSVLELSGCRLEHSQPIEQGRQGLLLALRQKTKLGRQLLNRRPVAFPT